jgi:hypothetical protein
MVGYSETIPNRPLTNIIGSDSAIPRAVGSLPRTPIRDNFPTADHTETIANTLAIRINRPDEIYREKVSQLEIVFELRPV